MLEVEKEISRDEAEELLGLEGSEVMGLFAAANILRERHKGPYVFLCSIINAKSGRCGENCGFCAQSARFNTHIEEYPLVSPERILDAARAGEKDGAREFSIVTSGKGLNREDELLNVEEAIRFIQKETALKSCASLGIMEKSLLERFKDAGLAKYHHNLEVARSFFPQMCTTHDYEEDISAVRAAKEAGLKVCSGGIFGVGETKAQRVELLFTLKELDVDSVPINFLNPIPGTPFEGVRDLNPLDCLKIIAVARLILPDKDIVVCGGREVNLRSLEPMMFLAGANGTLTGDYLTTQGRSPEEDRKMITDLGLKVASAEVLMS